jgi:XTP/dITP diphosphohydrolase
MKKILIGTGNPAKLKAFRKLLEEFNLQLNIISAADLNIPEPDETAPSMEDEAIRKAKYYYEKSKLPVIVDDGGFMVDSLNGEPGSKSRRWIGREMSDEEIISEIFKRMEGQSDRKARHVVHVAIATPFGIFTSDAAIEGVIPEKPSEKREERFPYRSVLYLPNYGKYWADLTEEEEAILSHRKHAVEKLHDIIKEIAK